MAPAGLLRASGAAYYYLSILRAADMRRLCVMAVVGVSALVSAQTPPQRPVEWPYWGGDAAQTKYSTLDDITPANVRQLELAWTWTTVDKPMPDVRPGNMETTPVMIDDMLYVSTSFQQIAALNPETGQQLW